MEGMEREGSTATVRKDVEKTHLRGLPPVYHGYARITGPCGDTMEFRLRLRDGIVEKIAFRTDGCGFSEACGRSAARLAEGKRIEEAAAVRRQDILDALGGLPVETEHCALLAAVTLEAACRNALAQRALPPFDTASDRGGKHMKIAIPLAEGKLSAHFGHCECFALMDIDSDQKKIVHREDVASPPHEPGLLPPWLAEHGVQTVLAGGMGRRALQLFAQQNIRVIVGAPCDTPEALAAAYLAGTLQAGDNVCDH